MQVGFGTLGGFIVWLVGTCLSVTIIIGLALLGLRLLKRLVGEHNYPGLTMLLAVIGGVLALYQGTSAANDRTNQNARALAFANDQTGQLVFLAMFGTNAEGGKEPITLSSPAILAKKLPRFEAMAKALNDAEVKDLPSAVSMSALVQARAYANTLVADAKAGIEKGQPVNLSEDAGELMGPLETLKNEQARLYPVYMTRYFLIGQLPQYR